ncbi:MAG: prepilin-type N-terminal cleavage/methylation domain-containing protein [Xanthomonadales bacterium]|nr:prepilin-type N-terminal cleavage/methylation domain-containing protein [Xanthomonadales bacterium]MCB1634434.1 prepilin-type N-terminal cleavage/methylation domain-containing protein [Xanthomonadales bacterium]
MIAPSIATRMSAGRRSVGGFTLLEVLAAFVIFVLVFGGILETLSVAGRNSRRSADISAAAQWAQSKLDAVGVESPLEDGSESGRFDDRFRYRLEIRTFEPPVIEGAAQPAVAVDMFRIELIVTWEDGYREREQRFVTVRSRLKQGSV